MSIVHVLQNYATMCCYCYRRSNHYDPTLVLFFFKGRIFAVLSIQPQPQITEVAPKNKAAKLLRTGSSKSAKPSVNRLWNVRRVAAI